MHINSRLIWCLSSKPFPCFSNDSTFFLQVGDAYVVAGLLPCCGDAERSDAEEQVQKVCADVLSVARDMIATMRRFRADTGRAVHCRMGASLGPVLAGMLGRLQPRSMSFEFQSTVLSKCA